MRRLFRSWLPLLLIIAVGVPAAGAPRASAGVLGHGYLESSGAAATEDRGILTITIRLRSCVPWPFTRGWESCAPATDIEYWTSDMTTDEGNPATAGLDYVPTAGAGALTLATTWQVNIPILSDPFREGPESFWLIVRSTIGSLRIPATIADAPAPAGVLLPALAVSDPVVREGTAGSPTAATFEVILTRDSTRTSSGGDVTVQFATRPADVPAGARASEPSDFVPTVGQLVFPRGERVRRVPVTVPVVGDTIDEYDEFFTLALTNARGARLAKPVGVGTIDDDEGAELVLSPAEVIEGVSEAVTVPVSVKGGLVATVPVRYATAPITASDGNYPLARWSPHPADFESVAGAVELSPRTPAAGIDVPVFDDGFHEDTERFAARLEAPFDAWLGIPSVAVGIVDDDPLPLVTLETDGVLEGSTGETVVLLDRPIGKHLEVVTRPVGRDASCGRRAADVGVDFWDQASTVRFEPHDRTELPSWVSTTSDGEIEGTEAARVTAGHASVCFPVYDDDDAPVVRVASATASEADGDVRLAVRMSRESDEPVIVTLWRSHGTAAPFADFTPTATQVTLAPGETAATARFTLQDDEVAESTETVVLAARVERRPNTYTSSFLGYPAGLVTPASTVTIHDDDG